MQQKVIFATVSVSFEFLFLKLSLIMQVKEHFLNSLLGKVSLTKLIY